MKTLRFVLQIVLGIALPLAVQRWDLQSLSPERRAVRWNAATWGAALYAFGPLSMLGWCWVTRGAWSGPPGWRRARIEQALAAIALGVGTTVAILRVMSLIDSAVALALDLPP